MPNLTLIAQSITKRPVDPKPWINGSYTAHYEYAKTYTTPVFCMDCTSVTITDAIGRSLWQSPSNTNSANNIVWQTDSAPSGVYFYTIRDSVGLIQTGQISVIK